MKPPLRISVSLHVASLLAGICAFAPVLAADLAAGAAIQAAISGNTFRGSLEGSGRFEEFYHPNGSIHGPDYRGEWSIRDNRLCLAYDGDPASCWGVLIEGRNLTLFGGHGPEGSGILSPGNPGGFK